MNILGLNAYHADSSACIVSDGKLVCAIEEERIRRIKHWAGLPSESIKWCLEYTGLDINDIDYIAISRNPSAHLHKKIINVLLKAPSMSFLKNRLQNVSRVKDIKQSIANIFDMNKSDIHAQIENVEHHRAHIGSSFLVSSFEKAVCISVDGFGDYLSVMRGMGQGNNIDIIDWVEYPHSLGIFYTAFTQFLGFNKYGDEYKVMGLSAYGQPAYLDEMREIVKLKENGLFELDTSYFVHDKEGVDMIWDDGEPVLGNIYSQKMIDKFGKPREGEEQISRLHQDLASSVQAMYEEAFFHILNDAYRKNPIEKITLAGGCIQNSLANGKIYKNTNFKELYIPPASYDAGTCVGAAFWVWNVVLQNKRDYVMNDPYLGPEFNDNNIKNYLNQMDLKFLKYENNSIYKKAARDIADGKIVGWFNGRTEWGPRALGNRSILADPRRKDMKDTINKRIKRRESFRPFAPSVLEDYTGVWFELSYPVNFMEKVYRVKQEKMDDIPSVVHVDGTGRLQTVSEKINQNYYNLIDEFRKITNVPVLLNTSFNENEPIVNTPQEAIECFKRSGMDVLYIEDFRIENQ